MTAIQNMATFEKNLLNEDLESHSMPKSVVLHLLPGILIGTLDLSVYSRSTLIATLLFQLLIIAIIAPITEEIYFRYIAIIMHMMISVLDLTVGVMFLLHRTDALRNSKDSPQLASPLSKAKVQRGESSYNGSNRAVKCLSSSGA